jgi:hypothetical protein
MVPHHPFVGIADAGVADLFVVVRLLWLNHCRFYELRFSRGYD